jgi:hypothetical protein
MLALTACAVGQRPTMDSSLPPPATTLAAGGPTGTAGADLLLLSLEKRAPAATFTATYHLTLKLGGAQRDATVVHRPGATAVTIGDWVFIRDGKDRTCQLSTKQCQPALLLQRVSDVTPTDNFWASTPAIQIRLDLHQESGPPVFTTQTVGGQASNCISIPLPGGADQAGGAEKYCVAPVGIASLVDRGDVLVELTDLTATVDAHAFDLT